MLTKRTAATWHAQTIHQQRVRALTDALVSLAGPRNLPALLDIGCGDGLLARALADRLGATEVQGVDVHVRPHPLVPVQEYDGLTLPFPAGRFDVVTLCDVLHHAAAPAVVLKEALRVLRPQGRLLVKDHFRFGLWSQLVLSVMDFVGNAFKGVTTRGEYKSGPEWISLISDAGGCVGKLIWPLEVHSIPWRLIARSRYQFAMLVTRGEEHSTHHSAEVSRR